MIEKFKPVQGYAGIYEISNLGHVKSLSREIERKDGNTRTTKEKIIVPFNTKCGYHQIVLTNKDGVRKKHYIHRLVANAFLPNLNNLPIINHKNENKKDNRVENLEWCTAYYNTRYGKLQERLKKIEVLDSKGDIIEVVDGIAECCIKYSISKYLIQRSSDGRDLIKDNKCNFNFKIA